MADPTDDHPLKHLGEAETLAVATNRFNTGFRFVTDDQAAHDYAKQLGVS